MEWLGTRILDADTPLHLISSIKVLNSKLLLDGKAEVIKYLNSTIEGYLYDTSNLYSYLQSSILLPLEVLGIFCYQQCSRKHSNFIFSL